ncbi:MAG: hypothetical protein EXX96DRAFT_176313 [Benjaminiella poitrasii]|nr:MAG: hypothetical protein EXX96DRAFT_176313 [Benjaminiella poitrasii]
MLKYIFEEADFDLLRNDLNLIPPKTWTNMNMLEMFSERYHFNEASTTKFKIKSTLCSFWNEKANDTNAPNSAKRRAMALYTTVNLVIDSRPALSLINSNIKKQSKKILKDSLVQDAYDEILEAGTSHNENNSTCEDQQPEPKKRKHLKATDFKNVGWGIKITMLSEHLTVVLMAYWT